ncbi:MAG: DNA mismatch repair endonuclease MutL [Flavobacteriaceae bacterium]|nr:DNA mismatch repair endonuclease MutL [Flavobacteriaceae bacterium]
MSIIKLLPENVANQIAAGEVVHRPSSVVKELLENSIDSGANLITLIIKDAGKTLIQVSDNGSGMSKEDLKICCLRHSTSKIKRSEDLYSLKTMGFRGEALSSISSVAQVSIVSRSNDKNSLGYELKIDGGSEKSFNEIVCNNGTSISVKNIFFNVPARRNFLKSDNVELRHVIDEFHRVAIINHNVSFVFINNKNEIFNLNKSIFKERIVRVFGRSTYQKLIPIKENTEIAQIKGFVFKPEYSRKTKSSQFFFINGRFIKSNRLHHAVKTAYKGLIQDDFHPSYFLKIDVPSDCIDVNIHPNKTEIKFDDDQSLYLILISSIKHSLGQFNIAPTIDFESNVNLNTPYEYKDSIPKVPKVDVDRSFNPFQDLNKTVNVKSSDFSIDNLDNSTSNLIEVSDDLSLSSFNILPVFQLNSKYIVTKNASGIIVINQKRAHQRILYEGFLKDLSNKTNPSQTLLFPIKLEFDTEEIRQLKTIESSLTHLGFKFSLFNSESIEVSGINPYLNQGHVKNLFQDFLAYSEKDNLSHTLNDLIAKLLSKYSSVSSNEKINNKVLESLVNDLFACKDSNVCPFGKLIFKVISNEQVKSFFS